MSSAAQAIESMQGFEFYDKPMRITYSAAKSDAVAKYEGTFTPRPKLPKGEKRRRDIGMHVDICMSTELCASQCMLPPFYQWEAIALCTMDHHGMWKVEKRLYLYVEHV